MVAKNGDQSRLQSNKKRETIPGGNLEIRKKSGSFLLFQLIRIHWFHLLQTTP